MTAIITNDLKISHAQLDDLVYAKYNKIKRHSSKCIPLKADRTLECIITYLAILRATKIACVYNPKLPYTPFFPKTINYSGAGTALYTSGSSGKAKLALLSDENHLYSALGSIEHYNITDEDNWLLSLPLYHVGGLSIIHRCLLAKACINLSNLYKPTIASFVPTQLIRLNEGAFYSDLRVILLGGAPIPKPLMDYPNIHPTYGMTEMGSQVTSGNKNNLGHPLKYRDLKISNDGHIYVRGKTLFQGYIDKNGELDKPDEWFDTKDIGTYSKEKGLEVIGRADNMFISGGENIQPETIEKALLRIDGVITAKVYKTTHETWGHRPNARINTNLDISPTDIQIELKRLLPSFMIPDEIEITRLQPLEGSGEISQLFSK